MNSTNRQTHSPEEAASLWAARLEGGTPSAADRAALAEWLAEDPQNRALLTEYCQLSADLEQSLPLLVKAGGIAVPAPAPTIRRWRASWIAGLSLAAASLALVGIYAARRGPGPETIATLAGHRQSFVLADGTRVDLNAHSRLQVENGSGERRVTLTEGEAFFAVFKNPARPFIVQTQAGSVRVTGTAFDVRSDAKQELTVTVLEGSVQVQPEIAGQSAEDSPYHLHRGDLLAARSSGVRVTALDASGLEAALAWRQGEVVFQNGVPLSEALAIFARYHGRLLTAKAGAAQRLVGGRYRLDDLEGFLDGIGPALNVRVTREASGAVTVSPLNQE